MYDIHILITCEIKYQYISFLNVDKSKNSKIRHSSNVVEYVYSIKHIYLCAM